MESELTTAYQGSNDAFLDSGVNIAVNIVGMQSVCVRRELPAYELRPCGRLLPLVLFTFVRPFSVFVTG